MTDVKQFAFGTNERKGCGCPAVQAEEVEPCEDPFGTDTPRGPITTYDERLRGNTNATYGVVDEETAKKAWFNAILNELDIYHTKHRGDKTNLRFAREGVTVAKELGWL